VSARSEFRANVKAHRFVMSAPAAANRPQRLSWAARATYALLGVAMLLGAACSVSMVVGAALTIAGVK
jgi:hypothetical protein